MMKNLSFAKVLFLFFLLPFFHLNAQNEIAHSPTGLGFGFHLSQYQKDFGMGLNVTSPYFLQQSMAIRAKGNLMFHEHIQDQETVWTPYGNASIGLVGTSGIIHGFLRLYGEGGIIGLFPNSDFSNEDFVFGGYGLFGFEFYMHSHSNYFIELGGIGTGAKADKLPAKPIYSNGLLLNVGYRINL